MEDRKKLKEKLNNNLDKLGIRDSVEKEKIIEELDCLSNLIIDTYLSEKYGQRTSTKSK